MIIDPHKPQRKSTRLKDFDYRSAGLYFVTILTDGRKPALSSIKDNNIILSDNGKIAESYWKDIPGHYPNVILDEYIIMPDHMHGIIGISDTVDCKGGVSPPAGAETAPLQSPTLGRIIGWFKYNTTKRINILNGTVGFRFWRRNYYDHIIRSEKQLSAIQGIYQIQSIELGEGPGYIFGQTPVRIQHAAPPYFPKILLFSVFSIHHSVFT